MKSRFRIFIIFIVTGLISGCCYLAGETAQISEGITPFEKGIVYDIYLQYSDQETSVVEDTEIIRFDEVQGKIFIVVKSHGFKLQDDEGFLLWDAVVAILPDNDFRVQNVNKIRSKY
jgi:hypothetical protein